MNNKKIKVGLDFDGVVAYNPFRIIRYPITYFKKNVLGIKKLSFWYPKEKWQQVFWILLHESSILPAIGIDLFKDLVQKDIIEAHLVSARYSFLDHHLQKWLHRNKLSNFFKSVNINRLDEQPHLFKEKMIKKLNVDYYVEDNLDIVRHLNNKSETKIYWIYNILDRGVEYKYKFPYLKKALDQMVTEFQKKG